MTMKDISSPETIKYAENFIEMIENGITINFHHTLYKQEEPFIVHNVMSYKGKNYLKQVNDRCIGCSIYDSGCYKTGNMCCGEGFIWKSFDDIQITDELACMRNDIGVIYLKGALDTLLILEGVVCRNSVVKAIIYIPSNPIDKQLQFTSIDHLRLATAEEIENYIYQK